MAHGTIRAGYGPIRTISRKKKQLKYKKQEKTLPKNTNLGKMCRDGCGRILDERNSGKEYRRGRVYIKPICKMCRSTKDREIYVNGRWIYFRNYRLAHLDKYNFLKRAWGFRNRAKKNLESTYRRAALGT
jgi:hypothetical protein